MKISLFFSPLPLKKNSIILQNFPPLLLKQAPPLSPPLMHLSPHQILGPAVDMKTFAFCLKTWILQINIDKQNVDLQLNKLRKWYKNYDWKWKWISNLHLQLVKISKEGEITTTIKSEIQMWTCSWLKKSRRVLALTPLSQPIAPFIKKLNMLSVEKKETQTMKEKWQKLKAKKMTMTKTK